MKILQLEEPVSRTDFEALLALLPALEAAHAEPPDTNLTSLAGIFQQSAYEHGFVRVFDWSG